MQKTILIILVLLVVGLSAFLYIFTYPKQALDPKQILDKTDTTSYTRYEHRQFGLSKINIKVYDYALKTIFLYCTLHGNMVMLCNKVYMNSNFEYSETYHFVYRWR